MGLCTSSPSDTLVARRPGQAHTGGKKRNGAAPPDVFDYDLVVIGGGSGGLACAKAAADADPEARVAVLDYVKPSPRHTSWGLGGTCVNVGCIPKKLMHTAALLGEARHDQEAAGWAVDRAVDGEHFSWERMAGNVREHIHHMNAGYESQLKTKRVTYLNALGSFASPWTVALQSAALGRDQITAKNVVVAVGGRPKPLRCPGAELAIDSDDLFWLPKAPGKTLVVGASYVALECAGFLAGIGMHVTVMVRSIALRGFDQDCANRILEHLVAHANVRVIRSATPSRIAKAGPGAKHRLAVDWEPSVFKPEARHLQPAGSRGADTFDTVLAAIGRAADTRGLALHNAGLVPGRDINKKGEIRCKRDQTSVPHVYAIGDVVEGIPELTPAAIQAGKLLARRLMGTSKKHMDYGRVATTVFTPLEYGTVGDAEDDCTESMPVPPGGLRYEPDVTKPYTGRRLRQGVAVYRKTFTPLEWKLTPSRPGGAGKLRKCCYVKVIVDTADDGRIIGFHYLGPHAGEVTQGFAVAMRLGATIQDLRSTVGIHPTCAEICTKLEISDTVLPYGDGDGPQLLALKKRDEPDEVCET